MVFIHEKEANSILPKSGLKHLVAVTPLIVFLSIFYVLTTLLVDRLTNMNHKVS